MRRALWSWLLVLGACQPQSIINPVSLLGPVDLVIVDALGAGGELARASGGSRVGLPSGRVFVTSTDSNELRVFEPFRVVKEGTTAADWARAPNPLETLSIPVIEWPTMLAADEGKGTDGRRVTGAYVYASRTGANEVSVVSVRSLKTLGSLPVPGALTAFTAWMNVEAELVPGDTTLFAATWDGDVSRLWQVSLPTDDAALASALAEGLLQFTELSMQPGETIKALQVVPPSPARTFDGAPFCAAGPCLAVATRDGQGGGTTSLVELSTGAAAPLDFGGPMRRFALSHRADGDVRLYGILDEQYCGGPSVCGGVVSVELAAGAGSYVLSTDLQGQPMRPLRAGAGPITGLSIAPAATLRQELELVGDSSTNLTTVNALYLELGAFSSANGTVSFFDATAGLLLDYNALRSEIDQVALRLPGQLEDGAWSYVAADGSPLGTQEQGTLIIAPSREGTHSRPWRDVTAVVGGGEWQLQLFDGYLSTQYIYAAVNGVVAYG